MRKVLITGSAGFVGFHLATVLLAEGYEVAGYDGMTDYYDVELKRDRHKLLSRDVNFVAVEAMLEDMDALQSTVANFQPDMIVHLAAQAGVRYSRENPRSYVESNITGTFNVMQAARAVGVEHLLMASTSSVYGTNTVMPFHESHKTDTPLSLYAATKKATEVMGHSFAYNYGIPVTMFRFFTVYGPWGRPDMALFKFTKGIIEGTPIEIYNNGDMYRDFTYVEDLARAIRLLMDTPPTTAIPYQIVNIGNNEKIKLSDFIAAIEDCIGKKAVGQYMPMQIGDVPATWADTNLLADLTGYWPQTHYREGIKRFVDWYRRYYQS